MKDQGFTVTFNQNGNYPFLCIIHPGMEGFVQVLPSGVTVPTQAQRDAEAQTQLDAAVAEGERLAAAAPRPAATTDASGRTTHFVPTGPSVDTIDVMRFLQPRLQVRVGDTVTWTNNTPVPHTATFTVGQPAPELIMPQPQAGGPPNLVLNPQVLFPAGGSTFDGSSYANSGFIGAGPEATAGQSYSLTFTKAGTYPYICVLHADQGMAGVIEVGTGTGITPPSTGDAGLAPGRTGLPLWALAAAASAVAVIVLGALRARSAR
jgi:plastocyanin